LPPDRFPDFSIPSAGLLPIKMTGAIPLMQQMNGKKILLLLLIVAIRFTTLSAQQTILYKQADTTKLYLEIYYPEKMSKGKQYPAMIFFFGGGWINGDRQQFVHHAQYFSKRGMVCFLADYRTQKNNTCPFESLKDAKSAIRFVRTHAGDFGIDSSKIAACGGSAGGQLAAATALARDFNEVTDDLSVSCVPNALVLFNPVVDNGPGGYGYDRIGEAYKDFSPLHTIRKGAPPTIIFLGTKDRLVPVTTAQYYQLVMEKVGSRCDLKLYEGQAHGFFNYKNFDNYKATIKEADKFLQSIGFLAADPQVEIVSSQ
jgi:acetyl esterase